MPDAAVIYTEPIVTHEGPAFETDHGLRVPETTNSDVLIEVADEVIVLQSGQMMFAFSDILDQTVEVVDESAAVGVTPTLPKVPALQEIVVTELSEEEHRILGLTYRATNGDLEAFSWLFTHYAPRLTGYAIQLLDGDFESVKDVMQDVAEVILQRIKDKKFLVDTGKAITHNTFNSYVTAMVYNRATKGPKRTARVKHFISLDDNDEGLNRLHIIEPSSMDWEEIVLSNIVLAQAMVMLEDAFTLLNEKQLPLIRRYLEGRTSDEIAAEFGITAKVFNAYLSRDIKTIRRSFSLLRTLGWLYGRGNDWRDQQ